MALKQNYDDWRFFGFVEFFNLPKINRQDSMGQTIPSVSNIQLLVFVNIAPITVTNFTGGVDGQPLRIKGDGQTTIQNNASVKTNTAANKLLSVAKIYTFTLVNEIWIENE